MNMTRMILFFCFTNLALFSCNRRVYEGTTRLHHHLTDPPDLDRQVIVEEMIRKYWPDLHKCLFCDREY